MPSIFDREIPWRVLSLCLFVFLSSVSTFAQSDFRTDNDYNRDANSLVLAINNNGYRIGYRYSKRINGFKSRLLDIDAIWYQHYKEKTANFSSYAYSRYTYGKLNQLLLVRASWGIEKELYEKYAHSGVAILFSYNVGFSLGILKPYYLIDENQNYILFKDLENLSAARIEKRAPFFMGFDKAKPVFGGFAQVAFSFDINNKHRRVRRLELGASIDIFHRTLPILSQVKQRQYIATVFIAYRFGKKTDAPINF